MAFRRPRLNVKPNVQATRPVSTSARSQENTVESTSTQSQEDHVTQQNETITIPTIVIGKNIRTNFSVLIISNRWILF